MENWKKLRFYKIIKMWTSSYSSKVFIPRWPFWLNYDFSFKSQENILKLKCYIKAKIWHCSDISTYYCFYCISDQINAALVGVNSLKSYWWSPTEWYFMCFFYFICNQIKHVKINIVVCCNLFTMEFVGVIILKSIIIIAKIQQALVVLLRVAVVLILMTWKCMFWERREPGIHSERRGNQTSISLRNISIWNNTETLSLLHLVPGQMTNIFLGYCVRRILISLQRQKTVE